MAINSENQQLAWNKRAYVCDGLCVCVCVCNKLQQVFVVAIAVFNTVVAALGLGKLYCK